MPSVGEYFCCTCIWVCGLHAFQMSSSNCHIKEKVKKERRDCIKRREKEEKGKGQGKDGNKHWKMKDQRTTGKGFMSSAINLSHTLLVLSSNSNQGRGGTIPQTQGKLLFPSPGPFHTLSEYRRIPPLQQKHKRSPNASKKNSPHHCVLCTDYPPDFREQATSLAAWRHSPDGSSLHCRFS